MTDSQEEAGPSGTAPALADPFSSLPPDELAAVRDRGRGEYGCRHYRRRVRFITPCCGEEWWCRHCHNEVKYQQESDWAKKHELDRKRITEVVCALCETRQPVGASCTNCGVAFGAYSCTRCPFFDDDLTKQTYHCDDCGICRVGGRENYFHCSTCGSCYAANLRGNHVCVERAMHQNCPVCFEFLFESVDPTTVLRCGHTIHSQCLRDLERNTAAICPACPICKKSLGDYSRYWEAIDREVEATPVPPEYAGWQANVLCNDCSASSTIPFSMVAHKCSSCGSYNTRRMGIITSGGAVVDAGGGDGEEEEEEAEAAAAAVAGPEGGAGAMAAAAAAANAAMLQAMQIHELHALLEEEDDEEEEGEEGGDDDSDDGGGGVGGGAGMGFGGYAAGGLGGVSSGEEEEEEWEDAEEGGGGELPGGGGGGGGGQP